MIAVRTFALGPLETNCFLLTKGGSAVAVDPGGNPAKVLRALEEGKLTLTHILNTHLHCDHIYGNLELSRGTGAPILGNHKDEFLLATEIGGGGFMGLPKVSSFEFERLEPGRTTFLGEPCAVLATPGHTPGSLSFHFPESGIVFVGDLLFYRSIGRSDFPGGSMETLLRSVRTQIFTLPGETVVYPGHGLETTVRDEMLHNPFFA
jgi:hydroxyacylglutathione hydrolase